MGHNQFVPMRPRPNLRTHWRITLGLSSALILATLSAGLIAGGSAAPSRPDSTSNAQENKAEESVANLAESLRQQKGLPNLTRIHDTHLREDACESAKRGHGTGALNSAPGGRILIPSGVFGDVGNLSTFSYQTSNPAEAPPDLQKWATLSDYWGREPKRFGVGVCFAKTTAHPEGTYWIDVGYYMSAIKTFLYRVTFMWD